MDLSAGQRDALENLACKHAGEEVDFINIAHAGGLSELNFAQRSRDGWAITPAGLQVVGSQPDIFAAGPPASLAFPPDMAI